MDNLPIQVDEMGGGELAAVSREQSEIQSAIIIAKKFPRNEQAAFVKINKSLERPRLAEAACYSFPRGGKAVEGPSVDLARELARCWGNIRFGLRVVSVDDEMVHIKGYAYDMENNSYVEAEDKFLKLIQRKNKATGATEWVTPDERDLRELMNRKGAILVRNCILQVVPSDLVDDAIKKSKETLTKAEKGQLEANREDTIKKLLLAFDKQGVTVEMLNKYLSHDIAKIDAAELADLKGVWKSINDGQAKREDIFDLVEKVGAADLNKDLGIGAEEKKSRKKKDPEVLPPAPEASNGLGTTIVVG